MNNLKKIVKIGLILIITSLLLLNTGVATVNAGEAIDEPRTKPINHKSIDDDDDSDDLGKPWARPPIDPE